MAWTFVAHTPEKSRSSDGADRDRQSCELSNGSILNIFNRSVGDQVARFGYCPKQEESRRRGPCLLRFVCLFEKGHTSSVRPSSQADNDQDGNVQSLEPSPTIIIIDDDDDDDDDCIVHNRDPKEGPKPVRLTSPPISSLLVNFTRKTGK